ncbi:MAG: elongation factor P [Planctomycetes bacterium]|nr:elongation factor P [Planctomycetota bacterium]
MWIEHDESPWLVLDVHKQMPSARGASMLVKVRLRNPQTGNVQDITFKGSDKVNEPQVEQRPVQYLYSDTSGLHFMDQESYEQFSLTREELGELTGFMIESMEAKALILDGRVLGIELPAHVELLVTECPPPIKGGTSGNKTKIATLETGLEIQVPDYLEQGERVKVDTRDGRFVQRVKA